MWHKLPQMEPNSQLKVFYVWVKILLSLILQLFNLLSV